MRTITAFLLVAACGGAPEPRAPAKDPASFGPLEVGADRATYTKVNAAAFPSETHGGRMVDVHVNAIGVEAYLAGDDAPIPVGTVIVKTSREPDGSPGPVFVMEKRAPGFAPEHDDWWYAIHWADPPPTWRAKLGGPIYWRTPSPKADYCRDCHESFERSLGGLPR